MTNYELMFIIDPTLEDEKKEATVETVKGIIEADGTVGEVDVWGLRKLAYPIQKKNEGYYVVVTFQASPELPKELDRRLRISEVVMRHLIINKDEQ
ncbi:MAG: 30S ribosomal protein S6 [Clostridia bacterium]|mgnify:FL=1|nr:30S ribosomal protein S6 [Clostridiales bacterium]MDD7308187.1 30S ribosomal protein S6 [Eubacteriales bacterium]MDO4352086.1 30S ribosomal protein S6 [Clostridia bacterium]MDY2932709.1 30S ribosomal protein S6 [Anaerovoracaceae bacterium]MEE0180200.1 30S ribosomal protein S6 [Anaerovoracaceae bacterium]